MLSRLLLGSRTSSRLFFFDTTATTEIYTLSLHDALPILGLVLLQDVVLERAAQLRPGRAGLLGGGDVQDRKSTRLNSSHPSISYAVFCLKKKNRQCGPAAHREDAPPTRSRDTRGR